MRRLLSALAEIWEREAKTDGTQGDETGKPLQAEAQADDQTPEFKEIWRSAHAVAEGN